MFRYLWGNVLVFEWSSKDYDITSHKFAQDWESFNPKYASHPKMQDLAKLFGWERPKYIKPLEPISEEENQASGPSHFDEALYGETVQQYLHR